MEALDRIGRWAEARENWTEMGEGRQLRRVERRAAALKKRAPDGTEDYQTTITLTVS